MIMYSNSMILYMLKAAAGSVAVLTKSSLTRLHHTTYPLIGLSLTINCVQLRLG